MCERCAELEERVAWLESELGIQRDADNHSRLREVLLGRTEGITRGRAQPAEFVMALYRARGRAVTKLQLLEAVPSPSGNDERCPKIVDVWACVARKGLGADAISTIWGRGYSLTDAGIARVAAIIGANAEPPSPQCSEAGAA